MEVKKHVRKLITAKITTARKLQQLAQLLRSEMEVLTARDSAVRSRILRSKVVEKSTLVPRLGTWREERREYYEALKTEVAGRVYHRIYKEKPT